MSIPHPLYDMCRYAIVVEGYAGDDSHGAMVFSAGTTYRARIVHKPKVVQTAEGNEIVSQTACYVATDVRIDPRSRVTLPAGAIFSGASSQPQILASEHYPDDVENEMSHCVLRF